ncbi:pyruvate dehydrogenase protein X component, mitochondrial-like isoform X1 [Portunus trituberculatus]|uniref:pyruvate dehydrogenase protein X component, mitochondrial-like isoform X1 n=1 Tax=Portunus trituberculatus TaxID=210409 RepID=UPI001E1CCFFC|nr:pyruvate dehydrogenase protein X component, mitochondrial-like isoform X1 [Portunus trituberculatus]
MAGLGGLHRAASHLSRHLTRLRGVQAARHTQGHAALLHTTPALDAGVFGKDGDEDEGVSFMEELLEALTDMGTHYTPEVKESNQVTPHSSPAHHRDTGLGSEKVEVKEHSAGLAMCDSETYRITHTLHMSHDDHASASDQQLAVTVAITHEEDMVQLQKEELENIGKESHSLESLPTVPEHLDSIHEDHQLAGPTRIMPIEAASQIDPHPIDLTSDLTEIQRENLENFATETTETATDFYNVTEEYYEASQEEIEKDLLECEEREVEQGSADYLAAVGASSVPQLPDDSKDIKVGTVIALMVAEGEDWKDVEMPSTEETGSTPTSPTEETPRKAAEAEAGHGNFGPSVRLLLEQYGLREGDVPHGGPHGILVKGDVLRLIKERNLTPKAPESVPPPEAPQPAAATATAAPSQPPLPPAPSTVAGDGYTDVEVTNMRRTIAKRLTQSKSGIAHSYATMECCMDSLLELRKQYKADGVNVSVNDLIIKAVAVALTRCPEMNCVWQGDQLKTGGPVDVSIAVATPAGLITPIVRGADTRGLEDIAATVRDLATRAKANKLKLDEFQGGTFTISNLGMFGIREFSAIINPPQCGILAVGGSRLVPDESGVPVTLMASQLSYDRGAVDDLVAAEFLSVLKSILENPNSILLGSYASQPGQPHPLAALL